MSNKYLQFINKENTLDRVFYLLYFPGRRLKQGLLFLFQGLENSIVGHGIFTILILSLSISAYRKTDPRQIFYTIIIFALFAFQLFFDLLENRFSILNNPKADVI